MRKYKTICIFDSRLRRIRNNLRAIITNAVWDQCQSLKALRDAVIWKKNHSPSEREDQIALYSQNLDLQEALRKSICMCGTCQGIENDMIYFPSLKAWHCVKCDAKKLIWFPES